MIAFSIILFVACVDRKPHLLRKLLRKEEKRDKSGTHVHTCTSTLKTPLDCHAVIISESLYFYNLVKCKANTLVCSCQHSFPPNPSGKNEKNKAVEETIGWISYAFRMKEFFLSINWGK